MPSNFLEGTQDPIQGKCVNIPPQFITAPLLCHIAWKRIELVFQLNDT